MSSAVRRSFGFTLAGFLTATLGLAFCVLTSFSAGDGASGSSSDRALSRIRITLVGLGLAGLVITAVLIMLGRRSSRRSLLALIIIGAAMAVSAALVATVLPAPSAVRPVGAKPLALLGLAVGLLAWAAALATNRWRQAEPAIAERGLSFWWRLLALVLAVVIAVGAGAGAFALRTAYRLAADEYLEPGERSPAQPAVTSRLDGTVAWQANASLPESGGVYALRTSEFGLGLTAGSDVVSLDRSTGRLRWRYFRADLDSYSPQVMAVDGGRRFLIDWTSENAGYLVLDADSGDRLTSWPTRYVDDDLEAVLDDGALLGHHVGRGSDSIVRVDLDGRERWRFEPGSGKDMVADATTEMAVIVLHDSRTRPADQLIGLDLASGTQRWAVGEKVQPLLTTGETYVVGNAGDNQISELKGIDARTGRTSWTQPLRPSAGTSCSTRYVGAGSAVLQAVCFGNDGQNATVVRMATDGTGVQRLSLAGRWLEDIALTEDGRTVALARNQESEYGSRAMYVSTESGGWRTVALPRSTDPRGFNLVAAGNQVLLTQGGTIYALG